MIYRKPISFFILFFTILSSAHCQTPDSAGVYSFAPLMPVFREGDATLFKFIHDNIQYPSAALQEKKSGRVQVRATIDELGNISGLSVLRGVSAPLDSEAIRVVKLTSGMWGCGRIDSTPIKVYKTIPVTFTIDTSAIQVKQDLNFIGGEVAYTQFIRDHIQIPGALPNHGLWDTVYATITLNSMNQVINTSIVGSKNPEIIQEAKRLATITQGKWMRTPPVSDQGYITTVIRIPFTPDMIKPNSSNVSRESILSTALYTDSLFKEGYMLYQQGDYRHAISLLDESIEKKHKDIAASYVRVLCFIQIEEYDNACIDIEWLMHIDGLSSNIADLHRHFCTLEGGMERSDRRKSFMSPWGQ